MVIVDAHEDIAWNALNFGRDMLQSARKTRRSEEGSDTPQRNGLRMLGLPEWLEGGVGVVFGTLFLAPRRGRRKWDKQSYADAEEAHRLGSGQVDYYHQLADRSDRIDVVGSRADLDAVLGSWEEGGTPRVGIVLLMEGADPIRQPSEVEWWYQQGIRLVGPAWATGSRYASGNMNEGGLTDDGRALLEAMAEVGMILDVSHLAEEAFWEAVDRYEGTVIASHANPRAIVPGPRQLSDSMIEALAGRDGVIGIAVWNRFLDPNWEPAGGKDLVTLEHVAAAVDHVCQVAGDAEHVGLGTDFDGGFGAEECPEGVETVADLPKVAEALVEFGYSDQDVAGVMSGNWLRVLRTALPTRARD